ncbi:MAG: hypothetical protein ABIL44_01870 [candidate division WOR-3 bacterium]
MHIAVFISGIAAVMSQTIIIREMLAFFSGNELIAGVVLFLWLLLTGMGSLIYTKLNFKDKSGRNYAYLLFGLCFSLIFSFVFIRIAPAIFSIAFGELIDFSRIILISFITLCPPCIIFGCLFPAASEILKPQKVYFIESIGSFFGGIILSFILISFIPPTGIFIILISLLLFATYFYIQKKLFLLLSTLPLFLLINIDYIEFQLKKIQMPGQNLIGVFESKYGNIAVTKSETQINFYSNGVFDFSYPDLYSSEEAVHYPLLIHPKPERVLLIGGGIGGGIKEILKHPSIKKLTYLELDPKIIEISKNFVDFQITDSRLNIITGDGRYYIKNTEELFDCIIINLSDPINAQLNRYYTLEFFRESKSKLNQNGIFCVRVNYTPDILSPIYSQFLGTIKNTLKQIFKEVIILPVAKATYIAMDYTIEFGVKEILKKNIRDRNLNPVYVNQYFFNYSLTEERIEYINKRIEKATFTINTDLKPVCYFFNAVLWGGISSEILKNFFIKLFNISPKLFFLILIPILFLWHRRTIIYLSVFTTGATGISFEIILLILFQVLYGYVYNWIGIIISLFMLGLAAGTLFFIWIEKLFIVKNKLQKKIHLLSAIQFTIAIYFLIILLFAITKMSFTNYIIAVLIFVGGFLGGLHFPVALDIAGESSAGILYGVDLFGASLGALVTAIIFIPVLGILNTSLIFILWNLIVSLGLFQTRVPD